MIFKGFGDRLLPLEFCVAKGRNTSASLRFKKNEGGIYWPDTVKSQEMNSAGLQKQLDWV